MNTKFILIENTTTVEAVAQALQDVPAAKRMGWYVVVGLAAGGFAVIDAQDLAEAIEKHGTGALALALRDVPGLLVPSLAVERDAQGIGVARRTMYRSPRLRLVVLEHGQPIGLLVDVNRAGGFGGAMAVLFGRKRPPDTSGSHAKVRCPVDGEVYNFDDVIDLATNRLICPKGHLIEE